MCQCVKILLLAGGIMFWGMAASAAEIREIELKDGSVIRAKILSFSEGVYTLDSDVMGKLLIEDAKIREIRSPALGNQAPKTVQPDTQKSSMPGGTGLNLSGLQEAITGNPETMRIIMSLQDDPEMQKIIQDPALMQAVGNGDIGALLSSPDFLKLLENPKIREITKGLAE
ncbi:MAG: hypothetical protein V2I97_07615 [Desulfococcaceae bacterium]|nr:hypothetical protein [Desulfococcaceae bacterium]